MLAIAILASGGLLPLRPSPVDLFVDSTATCAVADGSQAAPFCTLTEALAAAVPGEVIRIAGGTYEETVVVPADVHFIGTDGAEATIIDGNRLDTVMRIRSGANVVIDGLTITKGSGQPGGILNDGSLTLRNSTVSDNFHVGNAAGAGGIYHTQQAGELTLRNCTIAANRSTAYGNFGGGILAYGTGPVTIVNSLFERNYADSASAFAISSSLVRIEGTTLTMNRSYGGTAFVQSSDATIKNTTISRNFGSGLKIAPLAGAPTRVDHCTLYKNFVRMYAPSEYETGLTVDSLLGDVILSNTIIAGASLYAYQGSIIGAPLTAGNNFIAEIEGSNAPAFQNGVNGDQVGRHPFVLDPRLGRVRDHGGLTPTVAPLRESPVIGGGSVAQALSTDQRGLPWPSGPSDIGAVRYSFDRSPAICVAESNSTGQAGDLFATGSQVALDNGLQLTMTALPPGQLAVVLMGTGVGVTPFPAGSEGILCLAGPFGRLLGPGQIVTTGATGAASLAVDLPAIPQFFGPGLHLEVNAGTTLIFQAWHRDTSQGVPTSNFTGAASVNFR